MSMISVLDVGLQRKTNSSVKLLKSHKNLSTYHTELQSTKFVMPQPLKARILHIENDSNEKTSFRRNEYAVQSLLAMGGSNVNKLHECLKYYRVGGSTTDKLRYLAGYKDLAGLSSIDIPPVDIAAEIFGKENIGKHIICMPSEIKADMTVKFNTYSGTIFKNANLNKKADVAIYTYEMFKELYDDWTIDGNSSLMPNEVIEAGSRPKLMHIDKIDRKSADGDSLGRVISMPSIMEQFIGFPIYKKVMQCVSKNLLNHSGFVAIGIQRYSTDWNKLGEVIASYRHTYEGDWSKFDQTVPKVLLSYAIDVMLSIFDRNSMCNANYTANFKRWYMNNIVHKVYLVDNRVVVKVDSGIASGSLFTSIIGSIVNYTALKILCRDYGLQDYCIVVYGDDHIVNYNDMDINETEFKDYLSSRALTYFGMKLSAEDMKIGSGEARFVSYERPIFEPGEYLSKGTHSLTPIYKEHSLVPFTSFDHSKGSTHRWNYVFKGTVSFLKYHFLAGSYNPIRPMIDSLIRIVNPESRPRDVMEHKTLLMATLCDNRFNHHLMNVIFLMYCDLYHLTLLLNKHDNGFNSTYNLFDKRSSYYKAFHQGKVRVGDRLWFRRVKMECAYEEHPSVRPEFERFTFLYNNMFKIGTCISGIEHYQLKSLYEAFYSRKLYLNKPSDFYRAVHEHKDLLSLGRGCVATMIDDNRKYVEEKLVSLYGTGNIYEILCITKLELAVLSSLLRHTYYKDNNK